jgi:1-hydroxycarotenoid 3,4-desaturase
MAPATLMLVAHVEQDGIWLADGGMHAVARAMERLAVDLGVRIRYGSDVEQIERQRQGSRRDLAGGESLLPTTSSSMATSPRLPLTGEAGNAGIEEPRQRHGLFSRDLRHDRAESAAFPLPTTTCSSLMTMQPNSRP